MSLRQRIGLILLLALGLFAAAESVLRTVWIVVTSTKDLSKYFSSNTEVIILTLSLLEGDFVIIIGCAPVLRKGLNLVAPDLSSSIRGILSRNRSKPTAHSANSNSHRPYYDLEMSTQKLGVTNSVEGIEASATTTTSMDNADTDVLLSETTIKRTDHYAVTHEPAAAYNKPRAGQPIVRT